MAGRKQPKEVSEVLRTLALDLDGVGLAIFSGKSKPVNEVRKVVRSLRTLSEEGVELKDVFEYLEEGRLDLENVEKASELLRERAYLLSKTG
ncbi:hypothetical protein HS1genome_1897 [Sulfodiicoccus acidiphilus]|uniref:Uncharacterized protein n=1 Tax=Sulfodiicoccus acidiphilus TaxID=1670455 RepID=A0A348B5Q6_9CREN|nr:hypothetical protein [Sulfodiicoccus acidiphilus]BBD73508.1 hypothetical protein HS1genome_1897 [Sulfodiicoccus acidiphilus]GGT92647.1 hypothetical protein GCM10007116_08020 [Sulfodiicoccus acidiphilus]